MTGALRTKSGAGLSYACVSHNPEPCTGEIAGGLNNMIMNVAQFIAETCQKGQGAHEVLILPRFTMGKNFFKRRGETYNNESTPFGAIFDIQYFRQRMRPCASSDDAPTKGRQIQEALLRVDQQRVAAKYGDVLPQVYQALRPGWDVQPFLAEAIHNVVARAGAQWSAVHLR
eukprot:CAMPEP_0115883836 /NCGR_PEP_ID=MMETSP0287-20121206/29790_1 /TAXON_ID=412157 /ORGANISM="Chrysochromulina rotalis, Strain UIO044" /LENGTH=171 /DNA_ID=CAMNT_0003340087 /DNA_START=15 /DNA_END=527 /DNA_ORIENTATION=+